MGTLINTGTVFASDATVGVVAITNPANAQLSDNSYATSVLALSQLSNYLKITGFLFAIPLDATITGITVSVERSSSLSNATTDNSVKLVKDGVISGTEKATGTLWPTTDAVATYGSSSDLWGQAWAPVDINSSTFGVVISASATLAATANIDQVTITIDYTGSNRGGNMGSFIKSSSGVSTSGTAN